MQELFAPAIAANRFGLGARPGELDRSGGDARGWLIAQLRGPPPILNERGLRSSQDVLVETMKLRREQRESSGANRPGRSTDANDSPDANARAAVVQNLLNLPQLYRPIYIDEAGARLRHAVTTDRPFVERLTQFWTNHFAVSIDKIAVLGLAGAFEREAIRPRVPPRQQSVGRATGRSASTKTSRARFSSCTRLA